MLICKGETSYRCSTIKTNIIMGKLVMRFSILEPISSQESASLFEDNTFYFYDEVLGCRLPDNNNTNMVGLSIAYNADLTCNITIKLTKGAVENEC